MIDDVDKQLACVPCLLPYLAARLSAWVGPSPIPNGLPTTMWRNSQDLAPRGSELERQTANVAIKPRLGELADLQY